MQNVENSAYQKVQVNHSTLTPVSSIMPCKLITNQMVLSSFTQKMGFTLPRLDLLYIWWFSARKVVFQLL